MRKVFILAIFVLAFSLMPNTARAATANCTDPQLTTELTSDLDDILQTIKSMTAFMKDSSNSTASVESEVVKDITHFITLRRKYEDMKTTPECEAIRLNAGKFIGSLSDAATYIFAELTFPDDPQYHSLVSDAYDRTNRFNDAFNTLQGNSTPASASSQPSNSNTPLKFTGSGDKVLDPITLPKGTYKVSVVTKEAFALYIKSLDESACESQPGLINEVNTDGDMAISAEALYTVNSDCRVILSTQNSSNPWTVTFERVQ